MIDRVDRGSAQLAAELSAMKRRIAVIERAQRAAQLGSSSIENGAFVIRDAFGIERLNLGMQPDGTYVSASINNPIAPGIPNPPTVLGGLSNIRASTSGLVVGPLPLDFSHFNVYVAPQGQPWRIDGTITGDPDSWVIVTDVYTPHTVWLTAVNLSGMESGPSATVTATPTQVVPAPILDGAITELQLAMNAVTEAKIKAGAVTGTKIAPDSISSPQIIAGAILAINIAANAIAAGKIAADVITSREITSLAILTRHLQANVIDATKIQAGVITAVHLATEIIFTKRLVLGDPLNAHVLIDPTGLTQYSAEGSPTFKIGEDPTNGNFLTVVDPLNSQRALASISDNGVMSATSFSVSNGFIYNGSELSGLLDPKPRGLVAYGQFGTSSAATTNVVGVGEIEFTALVGRAYEISTNRFAISPSKDAGYSIIFYTTNGSVPTVNSPVLDAWWDGVFHQLIFNPSSTVPTRIRFLVAVKSAAGVSVTMESGGSGTLQAYITDIGPAKANTGVLSSGGGTATPTTQRRTTTWNCTWHGTWNPNSLRSGLIDMVQGYYNDGFNGDNRSAFGFDDANIRSALAGATIHGVGLYLYSNHWYYNSGGYARIRTHNGTNNGVYPGVTGTRWAINMAKPQGLWIDLGAAVGNEFRDNTTRGFALDATDVARNLVDYGRFDGAGMGGHPILSIDYTK